MIESDGKSPSLAGNWANFSLSSLPDAFSSETTRNNSDPQLTIQPFNRAFRSCNRTSDNINRAGCIESSDQEFAFKRSFKFDPREKPMKIEVTSSW